MPKFEDIGPLLSEIRSCQDCTKVSQIDPARGVMPLVFCGRDPRVLVVSEVPPKTRWLAGKGGAWQKGDLFHGDTGGIQRELCSWFDLDEKQFQEKVFWIQRANCWIDVNDKNFYNINHHCSDKFINRCIVAVEPSIILTLGKPAAKYFTRFHLLEDIIGMSERPMIFKDGKRTHSCKVAHLYHPSPNNKATGRHEAPEQKAAIEKLRPIFHTLMS